MAIKHNQQIQKNHFHKDWYVEEMGKLLYHFSKLTARQATLRPRALRPGNSPLTSLRVVAPVYRFLTLQTAWQEEVQTQCSCCQGREGRPQAG